MTAGTHASVPFRRAIERRALWAAEDAARELPRLTLEEALQLVHLYAERGSPKYERAAMRWLVRYIVESSPRLQHFAACELCARCSTQRSRGSTSPGEPGEGDGEKRNADDTRLLFSAPSGGPYDACIWRRREFKWGGRGRGVRRRNTVHAAP